MLQYIYAVCNFTASTFWDKRVDVSGREYDMHHPHFIRVIYICLICVTCIILILYVWYTSVSYVWHASSSCYMCDIHLFHMFASFPYVWHASSSFCLCDIHHMHHSNVGHDSFICATWLIHMCDMTDSHVRHDTFIHKAWLIPMWDTTDIYDLQTKEKKKFTPLFAWVMTWLIDMCEELIHEKKNEREPRTRRVGDKLIHMWDMIIHMCNTTHSWFEERKESTYLGSDYRNEIRNFRPFRITHVFLQTTDKLRTANYGVVLIFLILLICDYFQTGKKTRTCPQQSPLSSNSCSLHGETPPQPPPQGQTLPADLGCDFVSVVLCVYGCVCVCVRERERDRERGRVKKFTIYISHWLMWIHP